MVLIQFNTVNKRKEGNFLQFIENMKLEAKCKEIGKKSSENQPVPQFSDLNIRRSCDLILNFYIFIDT